jgi:hypothetical protein
MPRARDASITMQNIIATLTIDRVVAKATRQGIVT